MDSEEDMFGASEAIEGSELQEWEYYVKQALDSDNDSPVVYRTGINKEPIEEWLENNKPSSISWDEYNEWIQVIRTNSTDIDIDGRNEENEDEDSEEETDLDGLEDTWEALNESGRHICRERIFQLAKDFKVTTGKWMFWVSSGGKGDHLWSLVAKGIASGKTLATEAEISVLKETGPSSNHVVCIYNDNFFDEEQIYESERTIRSLGIKCSLHYKPDVYTHLGVYRKNPWDIKPILYISHFDILKNESFIKKLW